MADRTTSVISFSLILLQLFAAINAIPFTKYGRSCSDIGCLSSEVCVMAYDSCNYNQRENKECGRYPTCKKSGSSGSTGPGGYLNPLPENTRQSPDQFSGSNGGYQPPQAYPPPQQPFPPQQQPFPPQQPGGFPPSGYPNNNYYPQNPQYPQPGYPSPGQQPYPGQRPPPSYYNPQQTTEPSLWHQFLYNKSGSAKQLGNPFMTITLILVSLTSAWQYFN
ncbi:hypothetical protein DMENIID0001_097580 [Sergentomyia squamirostris]